MLTLCSRFSPICAFLTSYTIIAPKNGAHSSLLLSSSTHPGALIYNSREKCWRPTVQDIERISWGKPAKKKGTGSRGVPHRLNQDERLLFDQARRNGFLQVAGSGWRSERRDAPLLNSYRNLCDARGQVCIVLHKGNSGIDQLVVDLSPLRLPETFVQLENDLIKFVDLIPSYKSSEEEYFVNNKVDDDISNNVTDNEEIQDEADMDAAWETRPIYQLPAYYISWDVERSQGKALGKILAEQFKTVEINVSTSKKPIHVKPGKSRRHGGYGIG
jgi:hypothetical protein